MLLTIDEAAAKLRVSPRTIEREIGDGKLTVTMIRSRPRIDEADLQAYLSAQKIRKEAVCLPTSAAIDGMSVLPSAANNSRRRLEQLRAGEVDAVRGRPVMRDWGSNELLEVGPALEGWIGCWQRIIDGERLPIDLTPCARCNDSWPTT